MGRRGRRTSHSFTGHERRPLISPVCVCVCPESQPPPIQTHLDGVVTVTFCQVSPSRASSPIVLNSGTEGRLNNTSLSSPAITKPKKMGAHRKGGRHMQFVTQYLTKINHVSLQMCQYYKIFFFFKYWFFIAKNTFNHLRHEQGWRKKRDPFTRTLSQISWSSFSTVSRYSLTICCFFSHPSAFTPMLDNTLHAERRAPTTFL